MMDRKYWRYRLYDSSRLILRADCDDLRTSSQILFSEMGSGKRLMYAFPGRRVLYAQLRICATLGLRRVQKLLSNG